MNVRCLGVGVYIIAATSFTRSG